VLKIIPLIAVAAMLLSPTFASARMGSVGPSISVGNVGAVRVTQPAPMPPRIHSNVNMLKCQQYPRGNSQGGVIYVTVCS
jgi:hypothetical protein